MLKFVLLALFVVSSAAQEAPGAPEPYSYGYQTDSHGATEQKDPNGKVTGSYSLTDADGRERRVEYYADETGFHAKVQTNEVGTKSENSADVEVLASPPSEGQFVYQTQVQQATIPQVNQQLLVQQPQVSRYQTTNWQQAAPIQTTVAYAQQPASYQSNYNAAAGYGYYPGSTYVTGYGSLPAGYSSTIETDQSKFLNQGTYQTYNNHLPSQYYKSVQTSSAQPVLSSYRYSSSSSSRPVVGYQYSGVQTIPGSIVTNSVAPSVASRTTTTTRTVQSNVPSSSFQILKS